MWFLLFLSGALAIADLNCTSGGVYTPNAVSCSNVYDDATCQEIYGNLTAVQAGGSSERPQNCFNSSTGPSEDLKNMAIASCPQTCGYCCETPAYACNNAPYPEINCATVTTAMCQSSTWQAVLAANCPNVCGFCTIGGCEDVAPDCASQPEICITEGMQAFVQANCQRTCNLCPSSTTVASSVVSSTCVDSESACSTWVANGFCTSTFYTSAQKAQYCAKSCGLCSTGKK